ncbi:MAG: MATE family efflux transporter [Victivallales bacterium]|jgi:MATE family multidrug resistance protein|nr:MATE family efflux transporter [Victivallales bacterium]
MPKHIFAKYFDRREFTNPGGYREIWKIAWPLVVLNASNTIMMITNRVFIAQSSSEEIAAAMPAAQMFFTLMAFFLITTGFTATIVAQYHGSKDNVGCVRAAWNGFYFGSAVAALLAFVLPAGGYWIIMHNGHQQSIAIYEADYFVAMAPCAGFTCMETALLSFFTGRGKTALVAGVKIIGCIVCVPLNYILIFGKCGLPALGILGAGLANSLANLCTLLIAMGLFLSVRQSEYPTRSNKKFDWKLVSKLLHFGMPAGFQTFLRNAAFAVVIMMIGILGNEELAATSIALSINMLGNMPMIGLMDASSVITGQYIGRRKLRIAESIAGRSWRMLMCWTLAMGVFYVFAPEFLIKIFGSRDSTSATMNMSEVIDYTVTVLRYAALFNILDATRFITMGCLRGAGDTTVPLYIGMGTSWLIQIPGTVILVYYFHATIGTVWAFISFYIAVDAALMVWRRKSGAWKHIKLIDLPPVSSQEEYEENLI